MQDVLHEKLKKILSEVGNYSAHKTKALKVLLLNLTEDLPRENNSSTKTRQRYLAFLLAHRNLRLVSSATSASPNGPTKFASSEREARIATRSRLSKEVLVEV